GPGGRRPRRCDRPLPGRLALRRHRELLAGLYGRLCSCRGVGRRSVVHRKGPVRNGRPRNVIGEPSGIRTLDPLIKVLRSDPRLSTSFPASARKHSESRMTTLSLTPSSAGDYAANCLHGVYTADGLTTGGITRRGAQLVVNI